jgi:hypothetical protein
VRTATGRAMASVGSELSSELPRDCGVGALPPREQEEEEVKAPATRGRIQMRFRVAMPTAGDFIQKTHRPGLPKN